MTCQRDAHIYVSLSGERERQECVQCDVILLYIKRLINNCGFVAPQCTVMGERFDIFSKLFLQYVDMHKESSLQNCYRPYTIYVYYHFPCDRPAKLGSISSIINNIDYTIYLYTYNY